MNVSKFQVDSQISLLYISPFVVFVYMFLGTQFNPQMFFFVRFIHEINSKRGGSTNMFENLIHFGTNVTTNYTTSLLGSK
jgi:hypothetical protein